MSVTQGSFRAGLLDPRQPVPSGLVRPGGAGAGRRFDVYRNNVAVGLTEALETGFPAVRGLVGEEFFRALAGVFLRAHPPETPVLMLWGARLPEFLTDFAPTQRLPYLPDVARLEFALRDSYHAADAAPADPVRLAGLTPDELAQTRFRLAPSVRLVRSRWPVLDLWRAGLGGPTPASDAGQNILVTRPAYDPMPEALAPGGGLFLAQLIAGSPLAEAAAAAARAVPTFEPATFLSRLLSCGAIVDFETGDPS